MECRPSNTDHSFDSSFTTPLCLHLAYCLNSHVDKNVEGIFTKNPDKGRKTRLIYMTKHVKKFSQIEQTRNVDAYTHLMFADAKINIWLA